MSRTLVYIVRPGDNNEELRYSLRSLCNLEHGDVWIVGDLPNWVTGVNFIKGNAHDGKMRNVSDNARLAANHPDLPDRFLWMNDDFFFLKPYEPRYEWRWTLNQHLYERLNQAAQRSQWGESLKLTLDFLRERGHPDPLSYEVHCPLPVEKDKMAAVLRMIRGCRPYNPPQWRSVYGNYFGVGGKQVPDMKIYERDSDRRRWREWDMVSTSESGFAAIRDYLAAAFPEPCEYERRD